MAIDKTTKQAQARERKRRGKRLKAKQDLTRRACPPLRPEELREEPPTPEIPKEKGVAVLEHAPGRSLGFQIDGATLALLESVTKRIKDVDEHMDVKVATAEVLDLAIHKGLDQLQREANAKGMINYRKLEAERAERDAQEHKDDEGDTRKA